jgi:putative membrane protein insertion efficiency factor
LSAPRPAGPWARALRRACCAPIRGYARWISPYTPPTCRFRPTCSGYALEAIELHGVLRGGALALARILRCHPFSDPGHDPVPGGRGGDPRPATALHCRFGRARNPRTESAPGAGNGP